MNLSRQSTGLVLKTKCAVTKTLRTPSHQSSSSTGHTCIIVVHCSYTSQHSDNLSHLSLPYSINQSRCSDAACWIGGGFQPMLWLQQLPQITWLYTDTQRCPPLPNSLNVPIQKLGAFLLGTCESFFAFESNLESNRIFESNRPYIPRKP